VTFYGWKYRVRRGNLSAPLYLRLRKILDLRVLQGQHESIISLLKENVMAGGWSRDGAVQDQIDASVADEVKRARERLPSGESRAECEDCDAPIPLARQQAVAGVKRCVACQERRDGEHSSQSLFNRRGSKDSQLR